MKYGVWCMWDEVKPCKPGTDVHDPSIGKWHRAGGDWMTERGEPVVFDCIVGAAEAAAAMRVDRRHAHPPFVYIGPRPYVAVSSTGQSMRCSMVVREAREPITWAVSNGQTVSASVSGTV